MLTPSISLDALPASRELDALVAEKVMGWTPLPSAAGSVKWKRPDGEIVFTWIAADSFRGLVCWSPSTSIAAAWEVVEKVGKGFEMHKMHDGYFVVFVPNWGAEASTAPLTICRAAVKAVGATHGA